MPTENIGYCMECGCLDYHLVHETCPTCRPKIRDIGFDDDGIPLGADAGVYLGDLQPIAGDIPALCDES